MTKEEIAQKINRFKIDRTAQYERMKFNKQYINGFTQGLADGFNLSLECLESENERLKAEMDNTPIFHTCPECTWACSCSDQPCSCCEAEREWISVDVEKPKHESDIIFMDKNQNIIVGSYDALNNGGFFYDTGFTKRFNVTHWQNLPKPPKQ